MHPKVKGGFESNNLQRRIAGLSVNEDSKYGKYGKITAFVNSYNTKPDVENISWEVLTGMALLWKILYGHRLAPGPLNWPL